MNRSANWKIEKEALNATQSIITAILLARGHALENHDQFLNPSYESGTHDPFIFTKLSAAAALVIDHLKSGESIVIHGDYDADGVCGSTLLHSALQEISTSCGWTTNIKVYLPDRELDGYGVAKHTIERLSEAGTKLLITVDCGIANYKELDLAHELGLQVIVCDHHQLGTKLPAHALLIHPLVPGETYPNKFLCGTGVAFKLASAVLTLARSEGCPLALGHERWWLDLVAVATVTDVMPLLGENRVLEQFGLKVILKTKRPGLRALLEQCKIETEITARDLGFRIGPRLNAAGRLESAELAYQALIAPTSEQAIPAVRKLEILNQTRQQIFTESYQVALTQPISTGIVAIVYDPSWKPGIIGLIAGRIATDHGQPCFAFTKIGERLVGSGRSVGGLHLVELMQSCDQRLFIKHGGHPQACGLTLVNEYALEDFRAQSQAFATKFFGGNLPEFPIFIQLPLPFTALSLSLAQDLNKLAPFGEGNREPIFATMNTIIVSKKIIGQTGKHLKFQARDQTGKVVEFLYFNADPLALAWRVGDKLDLAYTITINHWQNRQALECKLVDWRPSTFPGPSGVQTTTSS